MITPQPMPIEPFHKVHGMTRKQWVIVLGLLIITAIVLVLWYVVSKDRFKQFEQGDAVRSPEETLQLLKESSQPVTATPTQQVKVLSNLQKSSKKISETPQQRIGILQALSK